MKKWILILTLSASSLYSAEPYLVMTDLQNGTVRFPPLFEQIRQRLIKDNYLYSFKEGGLIYMNQISETKLCVRFSNEAQTEEMTYRLEKDFIVPPGSPYKSAMKMEFKDKCE